MMRTKKMRLLQQIEMPQLSRPREGVKRFLGDGFFYIPLSRAEHRRGGRKTARGPV